MNKWQKGIFTDVSALKPNALFTAQFIDAEEIVINQLEKVRFNYSVVDANGEQHNLNRSFNVSDTNLLRRWLRSHTNFNAADSEMQDMKASKHLVQIAYYKEYAFIQRVLPLDGDLNVDA